MSLITTCPSCGTRFRVVADQLRISEGWVRCGQCQDVFDAGQHLDAAPAQAEVLPPPEPAPAHVPAPVPTIAAVPQALAVERVPAASPGYELPVPEWNEDSEVPDAEGLRENQGFEEPTVASAPAPASVSAPAEPEATEPVWDENRLPGMEGVHEPLSIEEQTTSLDRAEPGDMVWPEPAEPSVPSEPEWHGHDPEPAQALAIADTPPVPAAEALTTADAIESAAQKLMQAETRAVGAPPAIPAPFASQDVDAELVDIDPDLEPGFVRAARRQAWWQKPLVRVAMGAAVVLLPVALVLQVALHERNALVAWQPGLRPALEFMCTALQCKLGPRQQIAALVVSGSAFTKTEGERSYELSLSIQNQGRTPVGMPAVELTLTDAQDQAIARKIITAKELGAPHELRAGAQWSGVLPVTTQGLNLQVAGYRVLLFYP
ncbi:MAG: zinc-ribbon domain-containing protein [Acidovorax sp.]|jgi:predicted Zn finger-like uncharacterized protein|nr:zinc-ribbon domain-containing protein [Acidovorax sp.]